MKMQHIKTKKVNADVLIPKLTSRFNTTP